MFFVFPLENFNRDELINRVAELKSIKVNDVDSCKTKTTELLKIIKEFNPYFFLYQSKNGIPLYKDELYSIIDSLELTVPVFYADRFAEVDEVLKVVKKKEENTENTQETSSFGNSKFAMFFKNLIHKVIKPKEKPAEENKDSSTNEGEVKEAAPKKENKFGYYVKVDLQRVRSNKFHFLFLLISSFLFGFASEVGLCNALIAKPIAALFFVCAGVGIFLNTFVFIDYFKEFKFKDRLFIYSIITNIFGSGLSVLATYLFYISDKGQINSTVSFPLVTGIGLGMCGGMTIIAIGLGYLIDVIELKIKSRKDEKPQPKEEKEQVEE